MNAVVITRRDVSEKGSDNIEVAVTHTNKHLFAVNKSPTELHKSI